MSKQANHYSRTAFWLLTLFFAGMMVPSLSEHILSWAHTGDREWARGAAGVGTVLLLFSLALLGRREFPSMMAVLTPVVLAASILFAAIMLMDRLHVQGLAFDMLAPSAAWAACILGIRLQDWLESRVAGLHPGQPVMPPDNTESHNLPAEAKRKGVGATGG